MRSTRILSTLLLAIPLLALSSFAQVKGQYMESRSADVYTGQCFANGEVNLTGTEAILAWKVDRGTWDGVDVGGHTIAAAVRAKSTLGDPYADPYPAKAVVFVDDQATPRQQKALVSMAHHFAGKLLDNVVAVQVQPVILDLPQNEHQHGRARMMAGSQAALETRPISEKDHLCGNEITYYPPLVPLVHSVPAVALTDRFSGDGLGTDWTLHGKRSAFLGRFSSESTKVANLEHTSH